MYVQRNTEALSDLRILETVPIILKYNPLWSLFASVFTTLHILQNAACNIKVRYHISFHKLLFTCLP
jgi:hypothetical protein